MAPNPLLALPHADADRELLDAARAAYDVVGDLWGRSIPFHKLELAKARITDLGKGSEYRPRVRTCGTGLPGYASGWFRLANKEKALLYVTRRDNVVYIPTTDGYSLLLSVQEPERFLEMLRQSGA